MSKNTRTLFFTTSVAALTAFLVAGCDDPPDQTQAACEATFGKGQCEIAPEDRDKPVLMTDKNRPSYEDKQRCEAEFGVGRCETRQTANSSGSAIVIYEPFFYPGQTYYYPYRSGGGYYGGAPTATPSRSEIRAASTAPKFAPTQTAQASAGAARGGFGSTASGSFGGGGKVSVAGGGGG